MRADNGMSAFVRHRSFPRHRKRGRAMLIEGIADGLFDATDQFWRAALRQDSFKRSRSALQY